MIEVLMNIVLKYVIKQDKKSLLLEFHCIRFLVPSLTSSASEVSGIFEISLRSCIHQEKVSILRY